MDADTIFAPNGVTFNPQGAGYLAELERWLRKQPRRGGMWDNVMIHHYVKVVLDIILRHGIRHIEKFGGETTIPITHISLREVAYDVFTELTGCPVGPSTLRINADASSPEMQCSFGGMPGTPSEENALDWSELGIEALLAKLSTALRAIEQGYVPDDFVMYVMAPPISKHMRLAPDFVKRLREEGMAYFVQTYVEYIERLVTTLPNDVPTNLVLKGTSLGASMALEIGKQLLEKGKVHQEVFDLRTPSLHVHTSSPDGVYELSEPYRPWIIFQIIGLLLLSVEFGFYSTFRAGYKAIKRERPEFVKQLDGLQNIANPELSEKIHRKRRFWSWVWLWLWFWLLKGVRLPRNVRALMLVGKWDFVIPIFRNSGARVGKSTVMRIKACHLYPVYRHSVMKNCEALGRLCERLSRNKGRR